MELLVTTGVCRGRGGLVDPTQQPPPRNFLSRQVFHAGSCVADDRLPQTNFLNKLLLQSSESYDEAAAPSPRTTSASS